MSKCSFPILAESREQRKNVQEPPSPLSRNQARRAVIDLLWARLFWDAAFLNRIFWEHGIITPDDYQFLLNILVLADNEQTGDLARN